MSNAPHTPAAFINAIAEESSKKEAVEWLQKTWNERCQLERENEALRKQGEQRMADYAELRYWRDRHADIMHRRDHVNNRTLSEIIYVIRKTAIDAAIKEQSHD